MTRLDSDMMMQSQTAIRAHARGSEADSLSMRANLQEAS
jgi:hypothetical protein